ncbi:MAG: nucleotidyltransferase family protein [Aquihabitans sp.]
MSSPQRPSGATTYSALPLGSPARVLRQVCTWLEPGASPIEPLGSAHQPQELVDLARAERLLGPLLVAVDAGALALPDRVVTDVLRDHQEAMLWCLHLDANLLEVALWFEGAGGVDFRVLKGSAVSHLDEPDPSLRFFSDLDLLIAASDMDRAIAVLERHGAVRRLPQRRPGFDRRFGKGVGMTCSDGMEIDVHRTLTGLAHGFRIPLDDLFADPEAFQVGGETFLALSAPHRALHAAYHAVAGSQFPPLRTLRDMAGYLGREDLGPEVLAPIAERWGGTAVLAEAVRATLDACPVDIVVWEEWLARVEVDPAETVLLERGRHPGAARWPVEWSTVRELSWKDRASFLWAVAMPASEVLAQRGLSPVARLGQGVRRVAGRLDRNRAR